MSLISLILPILKSSMSEETYAFTSVFATFIMILIVMRQEGTMDKIL